METNLDEIRQVAKLFLHLPVKEAKGIPPMICVYHPFLTSSIVRTESGYVDIYENPEALKKYNTYMENEIEKADLCRLYVLIRGSYRLTFLKYCEPYMSEQDLAEYFADAWVASENPNQDANCTIPYLVKMFKKCSKEHLMIESDYEIFKALPETFTIYRGVAVGRNPKGLSWTPSLEKAKWFAQRFDTEDKKGYIQMATAKKEDVLAYFNTRGEDEIVYDSRKLEISVLEEV